MEVPALAERIITDFLALVGKARDDLSKSDLELLKEIAQDSAKLTIKGITTGEDVSHEANIITASLQNLAVAKYLPVRSLFWDSVQRSVTLLVSTVAKAAIAAAATAAAVSIKTPF